MRIEFGWLEDRIRLRWLGTSRRSWRMARSGSFGSVIQLLKRAMSLAIVPHLVGVDLVDEQQDGALGEAVELLLEVAEVDQAAVVLTDQGADDLAEQQALAGAGRALENPGGLGAHAVAEHHRKPVEEVLDNLGIVAEDVLDQASDSPRVGLASSRYCAFLVSGRRRLAVDEA